MIKQKIMMMAGLLLLGACASGEALKPVPDMNFSRMEAQPIYVAQYAAEALPDYQKSALPQGFVTDPAKNAYDFFQNRYKAAGAQGRFTISVIGASVEHNIQKSDQSVAAFFDVAKKDTYTTKIILRLQAVGVGQYETQRLDIKGNQVVNISEHVSLAERESLQVESTAELIRRLDVEVQKAVKERFKIAGDVF